MKRAVHIKILSAVMCLVIVLGYMFCFNAVYTQASSVTGTVTLGDPTTYLNVRTGPGTNNPILQNKNKDNVQLPFEHKVTILSTHN
ncbi:MAG TPA: hypothetical protein VFC76_01490, partial [Oscillospiraceae bacterium]|nr:hypothetical protein [Oscillospiraceae bacterium]